MRPRPPPPHATKDTDVQAADTAEGTDLIRGTADGFTVVVIGE